MFANALTHWKSSLFGVLGASLAALAITGNVDTMSAGQLGVAYLSCLMVALKGLVSADAQAPAQPTAGQLAK